MAIIILSKSISIIIAWLLSVNQYYVLDLYPLKDPGRYFYPRGTVLPFGLKWFLSVYSVD